MMCKRQTFLTYFKVILLHHMLMDKLTSMFFGLTFNPQEFFLISSYCEGDVSFAITLSGS